MIEETVCLDDYKTVISSGRLQCISVCNAFIALGEMFPAIKLWFTRHFEHGLVRL